MQKIHEVVDFKSFIPWIPDICLTASGGIKHNKLGNHCA
jgi:hypothetical protein